MFDRVRVCLCVFLLVCVCLHVCLCAYLIVCASFFFFFFLLGYVFVSMCVPICLYVCICMNGWASVCGFGYVCLCIRACYMLLDVFILCSFFFFLQAIQRKLLTVFDFVYHMNIYL